MKFLRNLLDKQEKLFHKGGKLERLFPLFEAGDTFVFTPGKVTEGPSHLRDGLDLKRMMMTVVIALAGCIYMAMYNTGLQAARAIAAGATPLDNWQTALFQAMGFEFTTDLVACFVYGALYFIPVFVTAFGVGITIEVLFCMVRGHEVNEGFFVTGFLVPLTLPPTIPLWQVATGIAFGVIIGVNVVMATKAIGTFPGLEVKNSYVASQSFDKRRDAQEALGWDVGVAHEGDERRDHQRHAGPQQRGQLRGQRLAAARLADEPHSLPWVYGEIDAVQDLECTAIDVKVNGQVLDLQQGLCGHLRPPRRRTCRAGRHPVS